MALHDHIDEKLKKMAGVGASAFTVSGAVATVTGTLSAQQLQDLIRSVELHRHEVVVAAGAVKIQPRS